MPMYNLLKYSDYYANSFESLRQFKRDKQNMSGENPADVTTDASTSFKYKSSILGDPAATVVLRDAKIVVPLKYLSNFFRSLEMPLINCKIQLELSWDKNCVKSTVAATTFEITSTKLYVPIVTLTSKDNVNLTKQLNEGLKRSVYWNEYKSKIETKPASYQSFSRFPLDASFQGVNRFLGLVFNNSTLANDNDSAKKVKRDSPTKYFLPRINITNYDVLINGRNFYDQPSSHQITKYE